MRPFSMSPSLRASQHRFVARGSRHDIIRPGNVDGPFQVDDTCIDCDTCRWMAPQTFDRLGNGSVVVRQPETPEEKKTAMQALLSCPTFSIHGPSLAKGELVEVQDSIPIPVEGCPRIYHCGYHAEKSFGATSYLIVRPEGGNILMDSPRFTPQLAKKLASLGGVKYMLLSHIDDIGDHNKWAKHFQCTRIIHASEIVPRIQDMETQLQGSGPWNLRGETVPEGELDDGVVILHTPGHTKGCVTLWHEAAQAMFTGDHIGYSGRLDRLTLFPRYNRAGMATQIKSAEKLLGWEVMHILPGHGRRYHFKDATDRLKMVGGAIEAELASA